MVMEVDVYVLQKKIKTIYQKEEEIFYHVKNNFNILIKHTKSINFI